MSIQEACKDLNAQYRGRDWYHSIGHNNADTITVYTSKKIGNGSIHNYYGFKIVWKYFGRQNPLK